MHYLKRERWGYSLWNNFKQYGAGTMLDPFWLRKMPISVSAARLWKKHGILRLS